MDDIFSEYFKYESSSDLEGFVKTPTEVWQKIGEQKALENFQTAAKTVPAYKDFLKKNFIKPETINTIEDFKKIPTTNKENYFKKYSLGDLVVGGDLGNSTVIHYSSGSTGKSSFWPKTKIQDLASYKGMELLYKIYFDLGEISTLFINCYGMGPWTAGEMVHSATKMMSEKGLKISIISPGTNSELFFNIFQGLADQFDQIIIGGYSSSLRDLVQEGVRRGIKFKSYKIKILSGGEKYSENWRQFMIKHLGLAEPHRSVAAVLGMSEVGVAAISTPFIDYLRILFHEDQVLAQKTFGRIDLPSLLQYIPPSRYIEVVNNNIIITAMGNIPIIRYDTKDHGQIFTPEQLLSVLPEGTKDKYLLVDKHFSIPNLPVLAVNGRIDKTIILFGANIYPEQLTFVMERPELEKYLTGRFIAEKLETNDADVYLSIALELREGIRITDNHKREIKAIIVDNLRSINSEYANVLSSVGIKSEPRLVFKKYDPGKFVAVSGKSRV
ncbi:MAG: hypothetical protein PHQ59_04720 [Candidatus Daviesbacteria bacterium]|nr:hypothetical protein [Candidatus Daviesbacteria bacterium]